MSATPDVEPVHSCVGCGASIYREHLDRGLAGYRAGRMLCRHCIAEMGQASSQAQGGGLPPVPGLKVGAPAAPAPAAKPEPVAMAVSEDDFAPLPLEDAPEPVAAPAARKSGAPVAVSAGKSGAPIAAPEGHTFRRALNPTSHGASRVRTFHCKLSDGAVHNLDQTVNSWLDLHPEIEIKFATTTVGVWEGKHPEPNLIMSVYY